MQRTAEALLTGKWPDQISSYNKQLTFMTLPAEVLSVEKILFHRLHY